MKDKWTELRSWNVGTSDGSVEKYTLSKRKYGGFKVQNDFGNVVIDMETMSGIEFFKKVLEEMNSTISIDCAKWFDSVTNDDSIDEAKDTASNDNCDSDTY